MNLTNLSKTIHESNVRKGFYDKQYSRGHYLMLVTSELSEALEAERVNKFADLKYFQDRIIEIENSKGSPLSNEEYSLLFKSTLKDTYEDEIADAIIRLLDHSGHLGIDIDAHIAAKLKYNSTRPYKHGKQF
jgi:NTP pyrophosphatase (non-canonical NTP hydrolase)